jgi:acyl-CoA-dependent ceramide synthase
VTTEKPIADEVVILEDAAIISSMEDEAAVSNSSANPASPTGAAPRPRLKKDNSTPNMNGPLYMQTAGNKTVLVRRLKRKEESTWKHLSRWFVENQIGTLSSNSPTSYFPYQAWIAILWGFQCQSQGVRSDLDLGPV